MKKSILLVTLTLGLALSSWAQNITVTSAEGQDIGTFLRRHLFDTSITISNVKFNNVPGAITYPQIGTFASNGYTGLGMDRGIVMTTGRVSVAQGPNNSGSSSSNVSGYYSDSVMGDYTTNSVTSSAVIDLDLVSAGDSLVLHYVFASEEYPEYVCSNFNDLFAILLTGPDPVTLDTVTHNLSVIPGTASTQYPDGIWVGINTVNPGVSHGSADDCNLSYTQYYVDNSSSGTSGVQYDGFTVRMTARATLIPGATYHLHIAVCNEADNAYDSGVFFEGDPDDTVQVTVVSSDDTLHRVNFTNMNPKSPYLDLQIQNGQGGVPVDTVYSYRGQTVTLTAEPTIPVKYFNGNYLVKEIPYHPVDTSFLVGSSSVVSDDRYSTRMIMAFPFYFFGKRKFAFSVGENGVVSFSDSISDGSMCSWSFSAALPWTPETSGAPSEFGPMHDAIYGVYQDVDCRQQNLSDGQGIHYGIIDEWPRRTIIANWNQVPIFPTANNLRQTYQIVAYEGTNIIEVHVKQRLANQSWQSGYGIIGIQNATGLPQVSSTNPDDPNSRVQDGAPAAFWPAGYNLTSSNFSNVSFRFIPQGESSFRYKWYRIFDDGRDSVVLATVPGDTNGYYIPMDMSNSLHPSLTSLVVSPTQTSRYVMEYEAELLDYTYRAYDTVVLSVQSGFQVTVESSDANMGTVNGGGVYFNGQTATLTVMPNCGYQFSQWSDGNTDNPRTIVVTQDTTLTAQFEAGTTTVSLVCSTGQTLNYTLDCATNTATLTGHTDTCFGALVIPDSITVNGNEYAVTVIGYNAFNECRGLTSAVIPNTVTIIGNRSFCNCSMLASVNIPNSVTKIEEVAFGGCRSLTSIVIPGSVDSLGFNILVNCDSLTSIVVDGNNSVYDSRNNCNAIIESATNKLLSGCRATIIPGTVTAIEQYAFWWCHPLSSIAIPEGVTTIGTGAFYGCENLTSVTFPSTLTTIADLAFFTCSALSSVTLPAALSSLGDGSFQGCWNIDTVRCHATVPPAFGSEAMYTWMPLLVPCSSVEAYQAANGWSGFTDIQGYNCPVTVTAVAADPTMGTVQGGGTYIGGDTVTLTAIPNMGYRFTRWSDGNTANPRILILTQDTTLTAYFTTAQTQSASCPGLKNPASFVTASTDLGSWSGQTGTKPNLQPVSPNVTGMNMTSQVYDGSQLATLVSSQSTSYCATTLDPSRRFRIMSSSEGPGTDANLGKDTLTGYGLSYVPSVYDPSITNSIRVGNCVTGAEAEGLYYTLQVRPENAMLTLYYAIVVEAPGHGNAQDPTFCLRVCRNTGTEANPVWTPVADTLAYFVSSTGLYNGQNGWHQQNYVWWREWNKMDVDVSNFMYETVRVEVYMSDCSYSGHYGYCYVAGACQPVAINTSDDPVSDTAVVTVVAADPTMGTVQGGGTYSVGDTATLSATPNCGYRFTQWNDGNTDNPRSVILTGDTTLTAQFETGSTTDSLVCSTGQTLTYALDCSTGTATVTGYVDTCIGAMTIPDSIDVNGNRYAVTTIGYDAFGECNGITSVVIPGTVTRIGNRAFCNCKGLTSVSIPNSVTVIEEVAFGGCDSLTGIFIPASVDSIGFNIFTHCHRLASIVVDGNNPVFDSRNNCNAVIHTATNTLVSGCMSTVIPSTVSAIGQYAFWYCVGLSTVTIPEGVTTIPAGVFWGCENLTTATIPSTVTSIGEYAFYYCTSLSSLTLPSALTSLGDHAFQVCWSIDTVRCYATVPPAFGEDALYTWMPLMVPCGSESAYSTANGWSYFSDIQGIGCATGDTAIVTVVSAEPAMGSVQGGGIYSVGDTATLTAMPNCGYRFTQWSDGYTDNPRSIILTGDTTLTAQFETGNTTVSLVCSTGQTLTYELDCYYSSAWVTGYVDTCYGALVIPDSITYGGNTYMVRWIGDSAFANCNGLTSINIGNSITSIGNWAFSGCSGLTSLTTGNTVTNISNYAFSGCSGLTSLTLGNSVATIGEDAFGGCVGLTSVTIPSSVTEVYNRAFVGCSGLASIIVSSGNPVYDSRDNCNAIIHTQSNALIVGCKNTIIPNTVTSLSWGSFTGCSSLISISIPNSVTSIGADAFWGCSGMTSVTIGSSVDSIAGTAFVDCFNLTTITSLAIVPPTITGGRVFYSYPTLVVPCQSVAAYRAANGWGDIPNIQGMGCLYSQVTAISFDDAIGIALGSGSYQNGDTVTLMALPFQNTAFAGWSGGVSDNPYRFVVQGDTTVMAYFVPMITDTVYVHDTTTVTDTIVTPCPSADTTIINFYQYDTTLVNVYDTTIVNVYDTVIRNVYQYDTTIVNNYAYDTSIYNHFRYDTTLVYDTMVVNVYTYDTSIYNNYRYDTVILNTYQYDTTIVYDTTIINTYQYDTTLVNVYDTVINNYYQYDTTLVYDTTIVNTYQYDTTLVNVYDTVIRNVYQYDTTIVNNYAYDTSIYNHFRYDTTLVYDTMIVNVYTYDTSIYNNYRYDTVILNTYQYDTTLVNVYDTTIYNTYQYDTTLVNVYDTVINNYYQYDTTLVYDTTIINTYQYDTTLVNVFDTVIRNVYQYDTTIVNNYAYDTSIYNHFRYDTTLVYDTMIVNVYTYDTSIYNNYRYDTVVINTYQYDTTLVNVYDTTIYNTYQYDTTLVNVYDTVINNYYRYDTTMVYDTTIVNTYQYDTTIVYDTVINNLYQYDTTLVNIYDTVIRNYYQYDTTIVNNYAYDTSIYNHFRYDTTLVYDTMVVNVYTYDTSIYNNYRYDTVILNTYQYDTTIVYDTTIINSYQYDTTLVNVYDTVINNYYQYDTTIVFDTTIVNVYDTTIINVFDTTINNNYVYDTIIVNNYVYDTVIVNHHTYDTVNNYYHDTVNNYYYDTVIITHYYHDTVIINNYIYDTIYLYRYLHDTIYIHDTIFVGGEGIGDVKMIDAKIYARDGQIVVEGAEGMPVVLYDAVGRLLATKQEHSDRISFDTPVSGIYLVRVGNLPAKRVVVIR